MANYGYVGLPRRMLVRDVGMLLEVKLNLLFGNRLRVEKLLRREAWDDGPVWWVHLPGTAILDRAEALRVMRAPAQDIGFAVALQGRGRVLAFRHGGNHFERWLQGCAEEMMCDAIGTEIHYDATEERFLLGTRRYRSHRSFKGWAERNFPKPLSAENRDYVNRVFRPQAPPGWWSAAMLREV